MSKLVAIHSISDATALEWEKQKQEQGQDDPETLWILIKSTTIIPLVAKLWFRICEGSWGYSCVQRFRQKDAKSQTQKWSNTALATTNAASDLKAALVTAAGLLVLVLSIIQELK